MFFDDLPGKGSSGSMKAISFQLKEKGGDLTSLLLRDLLQM